MRAEHRHRHWTLRTLALVALLALAGAALAQRVEGSRAAAEGLYDAEVPVRSQSEGERQSGFARALAQVLGKLSGQDSTRHPGVSQELRRAENYVERFDYRQDERVDASGARTFATMLVVRFRQNDVDAIATTLGLPVWSEPRPKPVLWLAIDDGRSGPRLVSLRQSNAVRPLLDRAIARGYRLGLPQGDQAEQALVQAIWNDDVAAISQHSVRYNPPMQLIGKLYRSTDGWVADWVVVDDGTVLARASRRDADARQAMAGGADVAADALAGRYARVPPRAQPSRQQVAFTGINSADDYVRLSAALQQIPLVRAMRPLRAQPGRLEVELDLAGGLDGFARLAGDSGLVRSEAADGGVPTFRLH